MEGKVFFLSPTCGALRMMMIKSMIEKSGGLVEKREGARADYFVFDKTVAACRKKVEDLRRSFQRFEGAKPVHVQWLEQTLRNNTWQDPPVVPLPSSEEERERDAEEGRERESLEAVPKKRRMTEDLDKEQVEDDNQTRILAEESRFTPYAPNERRGRPVLSGHFEHALLDILDNLGKHRSSVLLEDKRCVVIYDGFPKARYHSLVLPKEKIMSIHDLKRSNLEVLRHMHEIAVKLTKHLRQDSGCEELSFRIGYHSIPSLKLLHLHVISTDFDSPCLKNKKHWNSFQPPFFIDSGMLMEDLERNGKISINKEQALQWLKDDMISHRTEEKMKNIPALKDHLARCKKPVCTGKVY
uniref:BRCT domain-containing protein n=1 Tax=Guillardia theta TaxID=55529 RepID=A0A7S4M079_GUITH|mmetsp:Transcript_114/g.255  ORF Transcript_114/g.255 Transcript_114/m.255 type:complete len:355 (+) Transcript_114:1-1065(+)